MIYVTLLDQFHPGIYSSQVIDVCDYLNHKYKANIRVVAFLSIKELRNTDAKKKLKELSPSALVLPAFPRLKYFEWTALLLFFVCLFTGERIAICRNVFCTKMALRVKKLGLLKKVVMDGRSAMAAEIGEYDVFPVDYLRKNVAKFEAYAVNNADFRMAVSNKLVEYWNQHYKYNSSNHIVVPCTLDRKYFAEEQIANEIKIQHIKKELGILEGDIVLAYAGSTAPWQSFELLEKMFAPLLERNEKIKLLFLSKESTDNKKLRERFKNRVFVKWVDHALVLDHLACCDYGILVREQSNTNKVASPTKLAEYLYAGLKVLISQNLGDFSEFVRANNSGYVLNEDVNTWPTLTNTSASEKMELRKLAITNFRKESELNDKAYSVLMNYLKEKIN